METISGTLRIYRICPEEMTIGQIRKYFSSFSDDCPVGRFSIFYDSDSDIIYFGSEPDPKAEDFCIRMLSDIIHAERVLPQYLQNAKTIFMKQVITVLTNCVNKRLSQMPVSSSENNPDSRFVTVADDIFQISKIVSVRRRDEGGRNYIEVFITNKKASIKKEFPSKEFRDSEYDRIAAVLQGV